MKVKVIDATSQTVIKEINDNEIDIAYEMAELEKEYDDVSRDIDGDIVCWRE